MQKKPAYTITAPLRKIFEAYQKMREADNNHVEARADADVPNYTKSTENFSTRLIEPETINEPR